MSAIANYLFTPVGFWTFSLSIVAGMLLYFILLMASSFINDVLSDPDRHEALRDKRLRSRALDARRRLVAARQRQEARKKVID